MKIISLATLIVAPLVSSCIDRPIGTLGPRSTNVIVLEVGQNPPTKLDLLLVVDNSASMGDKQQILAGALPDLVESLISPACIDEVSQERVARSEVGAPCPAGSKSEFEPVTDIQVGVITSSLSAFGAPLDCQGEEEADMAHLLGTLPRGSVVPTDGGILKWQAGNDPTPFIDAFSQLAALAGEKGCGWESGLEAWYRFLIEPAPYVAMQKVKCTPEATKKLCTRADTDETGARRIDAELLKQRAAFVRPDSTLAIVMLSDENDCSFRESDRAWLLAQTQVPSQAQADRNERFNAWRGSTACATDSDDACCQSCAFEPKAECPSETRADGRGVAAGCAENQGRFQAPSLGEATNDAINLRCFEQKRRFGIDLLYPEERYVNALSKAKLCPAADDLDPSKCGADQQIDNPLFPGSTDSTPFARSDNSNVFLVGIVGVPWQDIAQSPDPKQPLVYRSTDPREADSINWNWLLGGNETPAEDPLMHESILPRTGAQPATGEAVAPPEAATLANSINGHEWVNSQRRDLQYACIFPRRASQTCPSADPSCEPEQNDCTDLDAAEKNPLCQNANGIYGQEQFAAKAYPSLRQLRVLRGLAKNATVASICAKETEDKSAIDFGYRPAMTAIANTISPRTNALCWQRPLQLDSNNMAACKISEVKLDAGQCACPPGRMPVDADLRRSIDKRLIALDRCDNPADCARHCACAIPQSPPGNGGTLSSCQTDEVSTDNGWCYIDAANGTGSAALVSECPATDPRNIRFVGTGIPADSSIALISCVGTAGEGDSF